MPDGISHSYRLELLISVLRVVQLYFSEAVVLFLFILCLYLAEEERAGPEVIKLFSCSTQPSIKFIMLINVKKPTIVGILTFITMINTIPESLKARKFFIFQHFNEELKCQTQLS